MADSWAMLDNSSRDTPSVFAWRNVGGPMNYTRSGPFMELRKHYEEDILIKKTRGD
jgi:hypothetical protein